MGYCRLYILLQKCHGGAKGGRKKYVKQERIKGGSFKHRK